MSKVRELLSDLNPNAVLFDGLDSAIIGIGRQHPNLPVVVYSESRIINELEREMDLSDAEEWYAHNIRCLWVGDNTPIIMGEEVETLSDAMEQWEADCCNVLNIKMPKKR